MNNTMNSESGLQFRKPTEAERTLLERLLETDFPGRNELTLIIRSVLVRTIDENGSLELRSEVRTEAPVVKRVPIEAEARDDDGFMIRALLHVACGKPIELEVYKDDGSPVMRMPPASAFELIVLPPLPEEA